MMISVIVITKNNIDTIEKCIQSLINQEYSKESVELLFIDGHSSDGTAEVIKKYAKVSPLIRLYYEDMGTMGCARNLGIQNSNGEIIAFIDADAYAEKDWLKKIAEQFRNDRQTVVLGGLDILTGGNAARSTIDSWRRSNRSYGIKAIVNIKTVNFAIKRDALINVGGFDPTLSHFDEGELMARLYAKMKDAKIIYDPKLVVYHQRHAVNLQRKFKKLFNKTLTGVPVLLRRHLLKVAIANPFSPLGTCLLFVVACILAPLILLYLLLNPHNLLVFLFASLILGLGVILSYSIGVKRRTGELDIKVPLLLLFDIPIRFVGTFVGLLKWLVNSLGRSKKNKKIPHS
jgi:glycosyltransferase involved in cell wall biosynthesis